MDMLEVLCCVDVLMVLVYDEYGYFEGIVIFVDLLLLIVGDFVLDWYEDEDFLVVECEDGSLLVFGWWVVDLFVDCIGLILFEDCDYVMVVGLVLGEFKWLLSMGDYFDFGGYWFEIVDMDGCKIDKLLIVEV